MKYRFYLLTILALSFCLQLWGGKSDVSDERVRAIRSIIRQYQKSGEDFYDDDVIAALYKDLASQIGPLVPKEKADTQTLSDLAKEVKRIVDKKYPRDAEEIIDEARKKAENKFKLVAPLTYVSILYERGDKVYKVDGIFYSYGGNSIKIDERNVAIFDLLPEYRVKFDKNYCELKKREFIAKEKAAYFQKKATYSALVYKKLKEKQMRHNEEAGYIYSWKEWRTLKDVANIYIEMAKSGKKEPVKLAKTEEPKEEEAKKEPEEKTEPEEVDDPEALKKKQEEEKYQEVLKKAEAKAIKIGQTYAGIDADQGYKLATWEMPRDDVRLLLRDELRATSQQDMDTILKQTGPIEKVELYYYHGYFYQVKVYFRIFPANIMARLASRMKERYGMTDEEKEMRAKLASQKVDEEEKADGGKKKEKKKEEKKKEAWKCAHGKSAKKCSREKMCAECKRDAMLAKIPQIQEYHWKGEITQGHLYVKLNAAKSGYEEFIFTKQNPKVKQQVDLMLKRKKLLEKQGGKKEDIDKKIDKIEF